MNTPTAIGAVHGILTRETIASWPDYFDKWMWDNRPAFHVIKKEYPAGPVPMWNVWVYNKLLAAGLFAELEIFSSEMKIAFCAHSNGADITLKTIHRLAAKKIPVRCAILTGGAVEADVQKNGILKLIESGLLGRAVAYSSPGDHAVCSPIIWPYGRLGYTGFTKNGKPFTDHPQVITRWYPDCDHGRYFSAEPLTTISQGGLTFRERTFRQMLADIEESPVL